MSKAGIIVGLVLFIIFAVYTFGYALPNYLEAEKEVQDAQREYDNVEKYGCANPSVSDYGVMCPNE